MVLISSSTEAQNSGVELNALILKRQTFKSDKDDSGILHTPPHSAPLAYQEKAAYRSKNSRIQVTPCEDGGETTARQKDGATFVQHFP
jgi:hypothetical protein